MLLDTDKASYFVNIFTVFARIQLIVCLGCVSIFIVTNGFDRLFVEESFRYGTSYAYMCFGFLEIVIAYVYTHRMRLSAQIIVLMLLFLSNLLLSFLFFGAVNAWVNLCITLIILALNALLGDTFRTNGHRK